MDKYLSIITNFGCHYSCPYCIVKENNLKIPKTTIGGLDTVKIAFDSHNCNWVSLSGGGDPLFGIDNEYNKLWYKRLFFQFPNTPIELHTSYIRNDIDLSKFARVVYHIRNFEDLARIKRQGNQIIRVVFVVTEDFTINYIDKIYEFVNNSTEIDELSFRQMVDNKYNTTYYCYDYLMAGHLKKWHYIEQNDYNIYYCENKVSYRYKDFESEEKVNE